MISYLHGKIIKILNRHLILDVNGVGYRVSVPTEILEKSSVSDTTSLFIHTSVREDDISLYGFDSHEALQFFELLLTVTRVGPKLALDMMNASLPMVKAAIAKKDIGFLASIPGVGRKTAERVILELRDKITLESFAMTANDGTKESVPHEDIIQALMKLGYDRKHVSQILRECPENIEKEEDLIKYFLKNA